MNTKKYEELLVLLRSHKTDKEILEVLSDYHENDIADAMEELNSEDRRKLYQILNDEDISDIFSYLDDASPYLEEIGLERVGAPGTTAALAMLNDMVKKGGVMASSHVGGLSGAFIPVSEDIGMIEAAQARRLTIEKLEAMTCVCSVGLDMIAIPGDTSANAIAGIIADEAAIGMVNGKTTAVRVIPAPGKKAGDTVNFGGLFGFAPVMPVNHWGNEDFIARGGRIPAPMQSLKN